MFFLKKPKNFYPEIDVVICHFFYEDEILLLKIKNGKYNELLWTAPGGKKNKNESIVDGTLRELFEETSIVLKKEDLNYVGKYFIKYPTFDFNIDIFYHQALFKPTIKLSQTEHVDYKFIKIGELLVIKMTSILLLLMITRRPENIFLFRCHSIIHRR